jgi:uncharacterized protein (TIGR00725 family)
MQKYQIGVMGSAADTKYSKDVEEIAEKLGELIGAKGHITVYGAEKDYDSLSTAAARGAKKSNGLTVGVTYLAGKDIWDKEGNTDVIIPCGILRGGGREFVLINSCDAVISVCGGSGTLSELAIAYQLDIPMVCMKGTGGWSEKLADNFIDERKRRPCVGADTPEEAVEAAIRQIEEKAAAQVAK